VRVVLSSRFEAELDSHLRASVQKFGTAVAARTFNRIDRVLAILADQPYIGRNFPQDNYYRYVVPRTPFVIYYQVKAEDVVVVAIRHGAQDRSEFERP
jgi:plasmid stabilization system protein ParE